MISNAIADDKRSNQTEAIIRATMQEKGLTAIDAEVQNIVEFIRAYVKNAPVLLDELYNAAQRKGILNQVIPLLNIVEQYFLEPDDYIPDHHGLVGLIDDAYLAQKLVEVLSDSYRQLTGIPLIKIDLSDSNNIMRALISEPIASQLDAVVMQTTQMNVMQQFLQSMMGLQAMMPMSTPHPIYGNMSSGEIADLRLGAMGVFDRKFLH